jgi:hypothetical protein
MKIQTLEDILNRCVKNGDCLDWTGAKHRQGYGFARTDGNMQTTMRIVGELVHGTIGKDQRFSHTCRNLLCCNPDHITVITHSQVCQRSWDKPEDRIKKKTKTGMRVTDEQIKEIKAHNPEGHWGEIAKFCRQHGITRGHYEVIKRGRSYKWVK